MAECDYCDATFADEDEYLAHLREAHEGDLGAIDRRRVEELDDGDGGLPTGPLVLGGVLVGALALVAFVVFFMGTGPSDGSLPDRGDQAVISQVEDEPASSAEHVEPGTDVDYDRVPPTGGPHYPTWVDAGFYEESQPVGELVHSLEHGAVVVWYDPDGVTPEAEESLGDYAATFTDDWRSFIAVPNPNDDPEATYVLTAWEKRLPMDEYDEETVRQFTAEYLGRGPENPVR